ncbi:DUF6602 domain-containing protein [Vibrio injensis]|uniref:DUF6602 domain-containing protein n=1 Tax=Vibrio injensis TaxID=1307414 RepID=UPI00278C3113|nr:DUF6602 domain-containing protein [Vibrio injensis]
MNNNVIKMLGERKATEFVDRYCNHSRSIFVDDNGDLFHRAEFGTYRERLVKELLVDFLPSYVEVGEGFICNRNDKPSTQCDLVVYNQDETPNLETDDLRRFFPIETVYAVGEVKSKLSVYDLKAATEKLLTVKKVRWEKPNNSRPINGVYIDDYSEQRFLPHIEHEEREEQLDINIWDPENKEFQNIVTFLICESIDLKGQSMIDVAKKLYKPSIKHDPVRHNFILSLKDGLLTYNIDRDGKLEPYGFPHRGARATAYRFVEPTDQGSHVLAFLSAYLEALGKTCIYKFDINNYIGPLDEKSAPMS